MNIKEFRDEVIVMANNTGAESLSFETVKDKIFFQLANKDLNNGLLDEIPWKDAFENLVYIFRIKIDESKTILISNQNAEEWNVDATEFLALARGNTPKLFPADMFDFGPMYVLTNKEKLFGAAAITYEGIKEKIADRFHGDYYIVPSSVHEVLCFSKKAAPSIEEIKDMIISVNENGNLIRKEEILSFNVYEYINSTGQLAIAESD